MIRRFATVIYSLIGLIAACSAGAQAKTEFCRANLWYRPAIPAASDGRSRGLVFGLFANSPRMITSTTIIADTDGGWYTWDVENVALTLRTTGDGESTRRVADFDKAVFVRHAWVLNARVSGASSSGWDDGTQTACETPSFGRAVNPPLPAQPPAGFPHVTATPTSPPYTTRCPHPFAAATVTRAVRPLYPSVAPLGYYVSVVDVAIGDRDNLLDAWTYKPSVNQAVDANALAAARASSYESAISYCRKVNGNYLFRADFQP